MRFFIQSSLMIIGICVLFAISLLTYNNTFQILIFHEIEASISNSNGSLNIQQNQPLQQQNQPLQQQNQPLQQQNQPLQQQNQPLQQQNQPLDDNLIIGSFGNDRITGTANDDIIVALSGSDTVHGLTGNDKIQRK